MKPICAVLANLAVCSIAAAAPAAPSQVPVYDPTQLALDGYTVVERIGVQRWRSAFGTSGHPTQEAARSAVLAEAARAGADAVTNLVCMAQTDGLFRPAGYYCYANAIKLRTASAR
jgi:hypothetical protein